MTSATAAFAVFTDACVATFDASSRDAGLELIDEPTGDPLSVSVPRSGVGGGAAGLVEAPILVGALAAVARRRRRS